MNSHTLSILEFPALIEAICQQAQSEGGIRLLKALAPSSRLELVQAKRNLYADMMAIYNVPLDVPSLRVDDLGEILRQVAPEGAVLDGVQLVSCMRLLDSVRDLQDFAVRRECEEYTAFQSMAEPLDSCEELRSALCRSLDSDGSVLDSASDKLRELRRQAASLENRIQRHLEQLVKSSDLDDTLQDRFVTLRDGRYVVPVKRDAKKGLPGIVHDLSNSGQTLFVEPMETHDMGNDLARTRVEEREEILRILAALSGRVRLKLEQFRCNQKILAELDAASAIARWAAANDCELPEFGRDLKIENGRHPLLQMQFRQEGKGRQVVPLNVTVSRTIRTIAITGSNTGGKTVVLRTIGLLSLAAQSGLPVPAGPGSVFVLFDNILADIGDEQSIQANLSTFSAHITNITRILQECRRGRSLVLLDELGGGTDPVEGGAIACGIIGALAKMNALCVVTTHLALVKNFVHSNRNMLNAAVRFNVSTLQPEYILDVGRPGASHALLIAKRLGLPQEVLASAQKMLSEDQVKLEDVLEKMENDQRKIAVHASRLQNTENELTQKRDALKAELDELRAQRRQLLMEAHRQADALVDNTRRDMENLVRKIKEDAKTGNNPEDTAKLSEDIEKSRNALAEKKKKLQSGLKIHSERAKAPLKTEELTVGLRVWIEKLQAHGIIERISGNKASVSINGLPFSVTLTDLERNRDGHSAEEPHSVVKIIRPKLSVSSSNECNVIGMRVEDALLELERFIDNAVLARLEEVRIVHGFGTGRLRNGIHSWLQNNPSVRSFYLGRDGKEVGAGGCTIVKL